MMNKPCNRLTIVEHIYFLPFNDQPTSQPDNHFTKELETDEQPYIRKLVAEEDKPVNPLIGCWLTEVSLISIVNNETLQFQRNPSIEELQDVKSRKLLVCLDSDSNGWELCPGESLRGTPLSLDNLLVKSLHGSIKFTIYAYPK